MIVDEFLVVLGYDLRGEGDLRRFERGMDRAQDKAESFSRQMTKLGGVIVDALATIGGVRLGSQFIQGLNNAGSQVENLTLALEALEGGSESASKAADFIVDFADRSGRSIGQIENLYRRARAFGLDPQSGSLQNIVDSASKYGADLDGVLLAIGQAQAKQKLQGEEVLQLVERGIPVWEMLTRVTGKSTAELQKMQQRGDLGLEYVQLLIDEMGRDAEGFSERQADLFDGMVRRIGNTWTKFLRGISESGYFDAVKERLAGVRDQLIEWEDDGTLDRIAQGVSDALVAVIDFLEDFGRAAIREGRRVIRMLRDVGRAFSSITSTIGGAVGISPDWANALGVAGLLAASSRVRGIVLGLARFLRGPAIVGALVALATDVAAYFRGEDSFVGQFESVSSALDGLDEAWISLKTAVSGLADALAQIDSEPLRQLLALLPELEDFSGVEVALNAFAGAINGVSQAIQALSQQAERLSGIVDSIKSVGDLFGAIPDVARAGAFQVPQAVTSVFSAIAGRGDLANRVLEFQLQPQNDSRPEPREGETADAFFRRQFEEHGIVNPRTNFIDPRAHQPGGVYHQPESESGLLSGITSAIQSGFNAVHGLFAGSEAQAANAVHNATANTQRITDGSPVQQQIINDQRQDNRQFPVTVSAPVTQNIQQIQQAPASAAAAVGRATATAVAGQATTASRSRIETSPQSP